MERTSDEHLHRAVRTAAGRADGGVAYGTRAGNPRNAVGDDQVDVPVLGDAVDRVRRSAGLHLSQRRSLAYGLITGASRANARWQPVQPSATAGNFRRRSSKSAARALRRPSSTAAARSADA